MRFSGNFIIVLVLFVTVLITSNIAAVKLIYLGTLPFTFLGDTLIFLPASIIIFPISYIVGDVLTEVYGFRIARGIIWLGFGANLLVAIALWITGILPPVAFWAEINQAPPCVGFSCQDAYSAILGQVPMILLASFVAYLFGEFSNSMTLALLKYQMQGRMLWVRTIGSTIVGQGLDSFIFIFIAFGVTEILPLEGVVRAALFQWIAKIAYETLATPLTYLVVGYMKRKEQMDVTDVPRSLNPLGIFA